LKSNELYFSGFHVSSTEFEKCLQILEHPSFPFGFFTGVSQAI